jgi:hypothetical protein
MIVVGKDCRAQVGLRVEKIRRQVPIESAFDFDLNSLVPPGTKGTIEEAISTADEGELCIVRWDNGETQVCPCGQDAISDLLVVEIQSFDSDNGVAEDNSARFIPSIASPTVVQPYRLIPVSVATIGLRVFQGQKVDYVVPGGPAHLSNMFNRCGYLLV